MGSVFGSCGDLFVTWEEGLFDENGNPIVRFTSADGESTLDICLDPLKGVTVNGEPVEIVDGVVNIEIAEDLFGSAVVTADTATITFPGQAPFDVCLNPVKTVNGVAPDASGNVEVVIPDDVLTVLTDNGDNTFTYTDEEGNPVTVDTGSVVDNGDGTSTVTDSEGNAVIVCQNPVKTVNGVAPDAAGNVNVIIPEVPPETVTNQVQDAASGTITYTNEDGTPQTAETKYSTTVPAPAGFHTITTDDGVATQVCLNPIKTINGVAPDATGAAVVPQAVVANLSTTTGSVTDAQGNTCVFLKQVDIPADVRVIDITTQESADGTQHDIFLQLSDGNTLSAGTLIDDDTFATVIPDNGDGTGTVTDPAGNEIVICLDPVKDVLDADGNSIVTDGVAQLPPEIITDLAQDAASGTITYTNEDGTPQTAETKYSTTVPAPAGFHTITTDDGVATEVCLDPVKTVNGTAPDASGNVDVIIPEVPLANTSTFTSNGDGTTSHDDGDGNVTANIQEDIVDGGSNLVAADGVTINPLLDCSDAPIDVTATAFRTRAENQSLLRLPAIDCSTITDCIPPDPVCPLENYFLPDLNGGGWEWVDGGPWVRAQKASCTAFAPKVVESVPNVRPLVDTADQTVLLEGIYTLDNPTCDEMIFCIDLALHAEIVAPEVPDGEGSLYFAGLEVLTGTTPLIHRFVGNGNGSSVVDQPSDTNDTSEFGEVRVVVPPKSSVDWPYTIRYRFVGTTVLASSLNPSVGGYILGGIFNISAKGSVAC